MILIQILLYMLLQFQQRDCAKLTGRQRVVFPELLESRSADGGKVLRITEDLTLNLEKSSILSKSFLLRTYDDRIMKHTYHDGEILEEDLYHDPKHLASVMVSEYNGIQVEGVLGPTLRIKPVIEQRTVEGRTAHVLYEIADDPNHNIANVGVQWREEANISERNDKAGSANVVARPELLAAVDSTFRSQFKSLLTLLKYIIIIFNSANVRYMTVQNPSVQLKLHALEVFDEYTETMFLYRVDGYLAAYRSLQTFRDYVSQNAHKYGEFDAVYLVTGLNMASYNGYGWNVDIQGIAFVAGACSHQKVGMGEDVVGTFFGVRIMSHEIGHLLGCPHDGDSFGQYSSVYCPWHQGFIMSYKVENSNSMKFSSCCQDNIRLFVESTGRCVLKLGPNGRISKDNYTKVLPGEYITKEKICQATFPEVKETYLKEEGLQDCQGRCYIPEHVYRVGFRTAIFPDKYRCRKKMYCINGECVNKRPKYSIYRAYK